MRRCFALDDSTLPAGGVLRRSTAPGREPRDEASGTSTNALPCELRDGLVGVGVIGRGGTGGGGRIGWPDTFAAWESGISKHRANELCKISEISQITQIFHISHIPEITHASQIKKVPIFSKFHKLPKLSKLPNLPKFRKFKKFPNFP